MQPWMFLVIIAVAIYFFISRKPKPTGKVNKELPDAQQGFGHFKDEQPKQTKERPDSQDRQRDYENGAPQPPKSHIPLEGSFKPPEHKTQGKKNHFSKQGSW